MLYSIILITQDANTINNLAGSFRADAKASKNQQKKYLDTITQDTVLQHVQIRSSSKSNGCTYNSDDVTTTTGSLIQLSLSESNCINNGGTTTTTTTSRHVVCHVVRQAPPAMTTTNVENSVGLIDDGIFPLEIQLGTPSNS